MDSHPPGALHEPQRPEKVHSSLKPRTTKHACIKHPFQVIFQALDWKRAQAEEANWRHLFPLIASLKAAGMNTMTLKGQRKRWGRVRADYFREKMAAAAQK